MGLIEKSDEQIVDEEYQKVASKHLKKKLDDMLGKAYNLLPVGLLPISSYESLKKKHKYFSGRLANVTSMLYEAAAGSYLIVQPAFSYVQNATYIGLYGNYFTAPLFSLYIPEQVFLVAGIYMLLDLTRGFAVAQGQPMGTWLVEAGILVKNWLKMKLLNKNVNYQKEAIKNVREQLYVKRIINDEITLENQRKALEKLQERLFYCKINGLTDEAKSLVTHINELRSKLGMEQL